MKMESSKSINNSSKKLITECEEIMEAIIPILNGKTSSSVSISLGAMCAKAISGSLDDKEKVKAASFDFIRYFMQSVDSFFVEKEENEK